MFRPHHMDDALLVISITDIADTEFGGIALKRFQLLCRFKVGNRHARSIGGATCGRRQIVIGHSQRKIGAAHLAACHTQRFKSLRAGHFVHEVTINIDQGSAIIALFNNVGVPDLLVKGAGCV